MTADPPFVRLKSADTDEHMSMTNRTAILALAAAGAAVGPDRAALEAVARVAGSGLADRWPGSRRPRRCSPSLGRRGLRDALAPRVVAAGRSASARSIVLQNAGIERTSVSHAALVVGAAPVLVALIAAGLGRSATRPITWGGYALALAGIALVAGAGRRRRDGGRRPARARIGRGVGDLHRRPAEAARRARPRGGDRGAVRRGRGLRRADRRGAGGRAGGARRRARRSRSRRSPLGGTLLPFWLFAFAQAGCPAELAGAFVNLEPVVGAAAGWLVLERPPRPPS